MSGASSRRRAFVIAVSTTLLGAALTIPSGTASAQDTQDAPIRLVAGDFVPASLPAPPKGLEGKTLGVAERGGYLVQFTGPVREDWKAGVAATGAEIIEYVPDFAFRVRMTPGQAKRVSALAGVKWVGRFQAAWKVTGDAKAKIDEGKPGVYKVRTERGADTAAVRSAAEATGAVVSKASDGTLLLAATPEQASRIAGLEDVAVVDRFRIMEKHNEHAAGVIMGGNAANARGYDGSTQTAAVADTGLGGGTKDTAHPDIPASRITAIHDWLGADSTGCYDVQGDGAQDVDSGHGTHTTVSVVGDGTDNGTGKAAAYGAKMVFQAVEDYVDMQGSCASQYADGYYLLGLPDDLTSLFQQAYDDGARIHSNSWGSDAKGAYTDNSQAADKFINGHRDMLITFSAGNEGIDANSDGVIDNDSMGAPATAKNVLTVGASENGKDSYPCDANLTYGPQTAKEQTTFNNKSCKDSGGKNVIPTWNDWWPSDYPADPIKSDPQTGNAQQMAAFSSRGPTDDNRIKPDVVAPGSWILSGYSDKYQQGYDASPNNPKTGKPQNDGYGFPLTKDYKYFSGTSMSNPLAAGGATVVRDFYKKKYDVNASAALVKGTLINTATDLLDENNDGQNDNDFPIPNVHEGWGLINLDKATTGAAKYVDEGTGLATSGSAETKYTVEAGKPLKVTLAYSDKEAAVSASVTLVNDLDLEVVSPSGTVYKGNAFSGGWSTTGGSADRRNNVENVYVKDAAAGEWTVRVKGYNVPSGPQKFALVVDGAFTTTGGTNANPVVTNPGAQSTVVNKAVNLQVKATDADSDTLTYAASGLPAGLTIGSANGLISGTPTTAGTSNVTVTVTDGRGGSGKADFTWTVTGTEQQLLANPGFESGASGWSGTTSQITNGTSRPTHGGSYWAALGGNGRSTTENLYQEVAIPSTATAATASYWVRVDTAETTSSTQYDKLQLQVLNTSGSVLATLGTLSNLNASTAYVRKSYDLSAYKGKTIRLRWLASEDSSLQTTFAVDDTALTVS